MPTYIAKVRRPTGQTEELRLTVHDQAQLGEHLSKVDGFVLDCSAEMREANTQTVAHPALTTKRPTERTGSNERSRAADLVAFTWYLHTMVHAGVPLTRALTVVEGQMELAVWKRVIRKVRENLERGESFADSLARFPKFFPPEYIHLIDVGEISGNLDKILDELALQLEKSLETRSQIKAAFAYPVILISACLLVVVFMVTFVLPKIAAVFSKMDMDLPTITVALLGAGDFARANLVPLAVLAACIPVGFVMARKNPTTRRILDGWTLTMPVLGGFCTKITFSRYARTLSLLIRSGVSLLVSLELARKGLRNLALEEFMSDVEKELMEGAAFGTQLARSPYIPDMVSTMVSVGEESGQLSDMLSNVARFYERDVDRTVKTLPKILEPVIIVVMTVVVGFIGAAIFIPLAKLPSGVGGH